MGNKLSFIKNSSIYFIGDFLSKIITFLLLPIYSKYILPEEFGYYDIALSYIALIIPILTVEIWVGMYRFILEEKNDGNITRIVNNGLILVLLPLILVFIALLISPLFLQIKYFYLILLLGVLMIIQRFYIYLCRALSTNKIYVISGILNTFALGVSNFYMILEMGMGLDSLFWASIIGLVIQIVFIEINTKVIKRISFKQIDRVIFKNLVKFSYPLCFGSLLYFFLMYYNKITIENLIGLEGNGFYAIAGKFTMVIVFLTSAFNLAWQDISFSMGSNKLNYKKFIKGTELYTKVIFGGSAILIILIHYIFPLMIDEKYGNSYNIIPLSIIATILASFGNFISQTLGALKETKIIMYSTAISTIVNVVIVRYFVMEYGINGVNITLIIAFMVNILIRLIYLRMNLKMPFNLWLIPGFLVYLIGVTVIYYSGDPVYNLLGLILAIFIFLISLRKELFEMNIKQVLINKTTQNVDS